MGMAYIFILTYDRYNKDSVNINLDTAYIHWTNTFPAVSTCIARNSKMNRIKTFVRAYLLATNQTLPRKCVFIVSVVWPAFQMYSFPIRREYMYYKLIRDYVFVTPITPIDAFDYCSQLNATCGINLEVFMEEVF